MKIVINSDGYKIVDIETSDSLTLLNSFRDKVDAIVKSEFRKSEEAKEYYATYLREASNNIKKELFKKAEEKGGDAICDIKITPVIENMKGDLLLGVFAQCLILKKETKND